MLIKRVRSWLIKLSIFLTGALIVLCSKRIITETSMMEAASLPAMSSTENQSSSPSYMYIGEDRINSSTVLFWSSDFHIAGIRDLKHLLAPLNAAFIDKSLSGHCHITKTCATDLKVLNKNNGIFVGDLVSLSRQFFNAYKNDSIMERVDVFMCFYPVAMCQLFMPFNKPIIVIAPTRYELGRERPEEWLQLNKDLVKIAKRKHNVIAGNSLYEVEYVKYFTGIDVTLLPSYCGYADAKYKAKKNEILLSALHVPGSDHNNMWHVAKMELARSAQKLNSSLVFQAIRNLYPHYELEDIADHPAIVYIPYQVSIMSVFEQYRMGIPLFFPSIEFLIQLHLKYRVISQRTWAQYRGNPPSRYSVIPKFPGYNGTEYDPNNEIDEKALKTWVAFADFYQWPHIQYFDSWDDCVQKIQKADLQEISRRMKEYSSEVKRELVAQWTSILSNIAKNRPSGGYVFPSDYDAGMATYV